MELKIFILLLNTTGGMIITVGYVGASMSGYKILTREFWCQMTNPTVGKIGNCYECLGKKIWELKGLEEIG